MVNFGFNFLLAENQKGILYELIGTHQPPISLAFRELTSQTALTARTPFGRKPIPSQGQIWLTDDAEVVRIDFSFRQDEPLYALAGRYVSEYRRDEGELLLPYRFTEYFYDLEFPERVLFESVATYSNFRKFSVEVKFSTVDP